MERNVENLIKVGKIRHKITKNTQFCKKLGVKNVEMWISCVYNYILCMNVANITISGVEI